MCTIPPVRALVEQRQRTRRRYWSWISARVKFTVCECRTETDQIGYRIRVEIEARIYEVSVASYLLKARYRMVTRDCETGECIVGPYVDLSGDDIPPIPRLKHNGFVGVSGAGANCNTTVAPLTFDGTISYTDCPDPELPPIDACEIAESCYLLPFRHSFWTACEEQILAYMKRFTLNGCAPNGGADTKSQRLILYGNTWIGECEEDTDPEASEITLTGTSDPTEIVFNDLCEDEYGNPNPLKIIMPTSVPVELTR
jgi:hypothetical protein